MKCVHIKSLTNISGGFTCGFSEGLINLSFLWRRLLRLSKRSFFRGISVRIFRRISDVILGGICTDILEYFFFLNKTLHAFPKESLEKKNPGRYF